MVTLGDIQQARERIAGRVHVTPLMSSATLASRAGVRLAELKCESFQKTGSFKVRGALNTLVQLSDDARARGVVTVSAGVRCTVVMPATAAPTKVAASAGYGATVIQHGTSMDAFQRAHELAAEHGFTFVHPFDADHTIEGTGTVSLEILEQTAAPDVVVIPIGGGGLISGMAVAIKAASPATRVIGVEPETSSVMRQSVDADRATRLAAMVPTIADGLAAPMAGERNFEIVRRYVDDVVLVSEAEIAEAMAFLMTRCKLVAEGAGAAATAALLSRRIQLRPSDHVVAMVSGGNVDLERLASLHL